MKSLKCIAVMFALCLLVLTGQQGKCNEKLPFMFDMLPY